MNLSNLKPKAGSRKKSKRVGRGEGSGWGCTSGKGNKGQNARSGGRVRPGFEGGQMPLARRVPKSGFTNIRKTEVATVNLQDLNRFDEKSVVDLASLKEKGLVRNAFSGSLKILNKGTLSKALTVKADKFSKAALAAIEKAGGTAETLGK